MTMIAGISFPEEVLLISDSRATYSDANTPPIDKLKKIYQIAPQLMFSYTTENVSFTSDLIENMTIKIRSHITSTTNKSLYKILKLAENEYNKLKNEIAMEFIYAGFYFDSKTKRQLPILINQTFPEFKITEVNGNGVLSAGSGKNFEKEVRKYYSKILELDGSYISTTKTIKLNKSIAIKNLAEYFVKKEKIDTVGGFIQIFIITRNGITPFQYTLNKDDNSMVKVYVDNNGDWIQENMQSGDKNQVVQNL